MSLSRFLPSSISALMIGILLTIFSQSVFGHEGWLTDMDAAIAQAKDQGKDILVDFSGSDWCHWCNVLDKEVFQTEEFASAKDDFVLLSLDFPQDRSEMTKAQMEHNEKWRQKFAVGGFPVIFLLDNTGRPYAQTGYRKGGSVEYLKHLGELQVIRQKRDDAMTMAKATEGGERAKHIDAAISFIEPGLMWLAYKPLIKEVQRLDADDKLGLRTKYEQSRYRRAIGEEIGAILQAYGVQNLAQLKPPQVAAVAKKLVAVEAKIKPTGAVREDLRGSIAQMLVQGGEYEMAMNMADEMLAEPGREGVSVLNWRAVRVNALASQKKFDEALAELDEIAKNPAVQGERAMALVGLRAQVLVGAQREGEALEILDGFMATVDSGSIKARLQALRDGISKHAESKKTAELVPAE